MIDRKELKLRSKEYAFNHKWIVWKPFLIIFGIAFAATLILTLIGLSKNKLIYNIFTTALSIVIIPLSFGSFQYIMKEMKGQTVDVMEVFKNKYKLILPLLILSILVGLVVGIGFVLLVVPGIILALRYTAASYIAAESDEEFNAINVMKQSAKMMDGHKWEYFVLQLSFIGWLILGELTLGVLMIWVLPYMVVTQINYYEELKKLNNK